MAWDTWSHDLVFLWSYSRCAPANFGEPSAGSVDGAGLWCFAMMGLQTWAAWELDSSSRTHHNVGWPCWLIIQKTWTRLLPTAVLGGGRETYQLPSIRHCWGAPISRMMVKLNSCLRRLWEISQQLRRLPWDKPPGSEMAYQGYKECVLWSEGDSSLNLPVWQWIKTLYVLNLWD